jgi:putative phage-type endonuclease
MSNERTEWLKKRKLSIGSSDAPAIHGKSPYLTELQLYNDKTSDVIDEKSSYVMEMGNRLEPEARKLFAAEYNLIHGRDETFSPKMLTHSECQFMTASLD